MLTRRNLIIGSVLTALTALGAGLFWYGLMTPLYSLWQAKQAFARHDLSAFERYVDVETITGRMLDQMSAANSEAARRSGDLWRQFIQASAQAAVPALKPGLVKRLKGEVAAYVRTGRFETGPDDAGEAFFTLPHLYQMGGGDDVAFRGIAYVKRSGKTSVVGLTLWHKVHHSPLVLELVLVERGRHWQVVAFNDLPKYLRSLADLGTKADRSPGR
jgi:hypothetical protein